MGDVQRQANVPKIHSFTQDVSPQVLVIEIDLYNTRITEQI